MTTILYPGARRNRDPEVVAQVAQLFGPTAKAPAPRVPWQGLFVEPSYADGGPYDQSDEDDEEEV